MIVLGLLTAAISYDFYSYSAEELKSGSHTIGVVRASIISKKGMHRPVIEFKNGAGEISVFKSSISSSPQRYFVGDEIEVLYFSETGKKPRIKNTLTTWGAALFFGGFSIFSFVMFAVIWLLKGSGRSDK